MIVLAAVAVAGGCSSDLVPAPPQARQGGPDQLRTGSARAAAPAVSPYAQRAYGGRGWGLYSGVRGQTQHPPEEHFAFRGDPNAGTTYAETQVQAADRAYR